MKVVTPGHQYVAANVENPETGQTIQFIEKAPEYIRTVHPCGYTDRATGNMITMSDGTTNEELIRILVDRLSFLQQAFPCKENACAITHLQEAENWLERRTRDREKRQVEGKNEA